MSHLPPQPISPLDGRYRAAVDVLGEYLSEAALNRLRVEVEIEWLIALTRRGLFGTEALGDATESGLRRIVADFGSDEIAELAAEEAITRHDVKAIEYFIRRRLVALGLANIAELTHFAATSEDINNLAYSLGLQRTVSTIWLPRFDALVTELTNVAQRERATPIARAHARPAGDPDDLRKGDRGRGRSAAARAPSCSRCRVLGQVQRSDRNLRRPRGRGA